MSAGERGALPSIIRFSLRFRGIVLALATAFLGYGVFTLSRARYDVFPEFAPPQVVVQTEAPGLAPEQVELLVTQPVENAINGVTGIESLRSSSLQGLSLVTVTFQAGSDVYQARQMVAERLAATSAQLPAGVKEPLINPLTTSTSVVLVLGMTSTTRSPMELRTAADWTVKQRLLAVPGVAKVGVFGGEVRQLQVQVRPDRLLRFGISLEDVLAATRKATGIRGAGVLDLSNQRLVLQTEGQSLTPEALAGTVVARIGGGNLTLGDIANVAEGPESPIGAAAIQGEPGVILGVSGQLGANTLEVTRELDAALAELRPALAAQGITLDSGVFRPATFIATALRNVRTSLLLGGFLVVAVLVLFLLNLRAAAISCTAIPLSLLAAVVVLEKLGFSINTMVLGGLVIAIGEVVDDAIIDVENILRRLRENHHSAAPQPVPRVVLDASLEVRSAVVYATLSVVLVFIPVLTLSGLAGRIFSPLGIAYILAVLASLLVALTLTPALCLLLLDPGKLPEQEPATVRFLKRRYTRVLAWAEHHPRLIVAGVALVTLAGLAAAPLLEGEFLPELREGHYIVHMTAAPGTSLSESLRIGRGVTAALLELPFVRSVAQQVGRAEASEDVLGTHHSEIHVDLKPLDGSQAEAAVATLRRTLSRFPGMGFAVKTFLTERIEEVLTGYTAAVVVDLVGSDLDLLDAKALEVAEVLRQVPGAAEVQVPSPPGTPQLVIRLRQQDLLRWGFRPLEVLEAVQTAYQGSVAGQVYEGNRSFDVAVILDPALRANPAAIRELPLESLDGTFVPLGQLADIFETAGRYAVLHEGARRMQAITCNVVGRSATSFVAEAKARLASSLALPPDMYTDFSGLAQAHARSQRDLLVHSLLAGLGVVLLLSLVMGSPRNLLLVLLNLPLALVGGELAAFATGGLLTLGSLVGFVTLFGISLRNSIMMISHYQHLVAAEGLDWSLDTAVRGASERLAPILMTAAVTGLGLLPLALGSKAPGREIEGPMAIVILGGLVTSTLLNLLVLPTLALRFGRFTKASS